MKKQTPEKELEEVTPLAIDPKGAERFTVKREQVGEFALNNVYDLGGLSYCLVAILNDGDGVRLEFVKQ